LFISDIVVEAHASSDLSFIGMWNISFIIMWRILLKFHWGMKALIELHFQHENVLRSTLSYPNETSKECIQFLTLFGKTCLNWTFFVPAFVFAIDRWFIKAKLTKISYIGTLFKVQFLHSVLYFVPISCIVLLALSQSNVMTSCNYIWLQMK
jgi:hypothetical protein